MIVVSDTSPIFYLTEIGAAHALPQLYGDVLIPPAVFQELCHSRSPLKDWFANAPTWLRVVVPRHPDEAIALDRGEREAIALAIEMDADLLLIDDLAGRRAASERGFRIAGTLAVILDASCAELVDFEESLARLCDTSFHMSETLIVALRAEFVRRNS